MRKNFGAKEICYPMPVFIIGTYNEDGSPNAMNAAWGGVTEEAQLTIYRFHGYSKLCKSLRLCGHCFRQQRA